MKIAIPTDDGYIINRQLNSAKGFLISTIQFGVIVKQEMRLNLSPMFTVSPDILNINIDDCEILIVRDIDDEYCNYQKSRNKQVLKIKEKFISNALMYDLKTFLQQESNTCCAP